MEKQFTRYKDTLKCFLTLPNEELIFVTQKHPFNLVISLLCLYIISGLFILTSSILLTQFFNHPAILFAMLLLIISFDITLSIKLVVDWYYYLYVITNKKILEVHYAPFQSHTSNGVLLDQVRCTEIDTNINGVVSEFLDMGDVIMTFDRPTHQEEFILRDISYPRELANKLSHLLTQATPDNFYTPYTRTKVKQLTQVFP